MVDYWKIKISGGGIMLVNEKSNPVYELEKKMMEQKFVVGKMEPDGAFETNEKMMYDFMNNIYEEGRKSKKPSKILYVVFFIIGMIIGGAAGIITVLQLIK